MLIATPAGQRCYLGALAIAVTARNHGWDPVFIGPDLPGEEIAAAGLTLKPQLIALSITCRADEGFVDRQMTQMADLLEDQCPFIAGGIASMVHRPSIERIGGAVCLTTDDLVARLH
jgi:hypothetical protein